MSIAIVMVVRIRVQGWHKSGSLWNILRQIHRMHLWSFCSVVRSTGESGDITQRAWLGHCWAMLLSSTQMEKKRDVVRNHYFCFRHEDFVMPLNRYVSRDVIVGSWDSEKRSYLKKYLRH